ncbi:MAG: TonB-dependent receptor [Cellvibrionaceae bacterium]
MAGSLFVKPFAYSVKTLPYAVSLIVCASTVQADHIEEILIRGEQDAREIEVSDTLMISPDSATLVKAAPGANVNANGPLTGIPQYRGMYGSRVNVTVNGTAISSGGPNWMDPPLSYAPAAQLQSLTVYRGIAPVSVGQETIGGAIDAKTWSGEFAIGSEFESNGYIRTGVESVNNSSMLNGAVVVANQHHKVKLVGLSEQAKNAEFESGDILFTEYERQRLDAGYAYKSGSHHLELNFVRSETGDSGTPALPMDIVYIDSDLANLRYQFTEGDFQLEGKLYYSDIGHGMTNFHTRAPGMMLRQNIAAGESVGAAIQMEKGEPENHWVVGLDWHDESHESDITDPSNMMFFAENFNGAEREVIGIFSEYNRKFSEHWRGEYGLRVNRISMDSYSVTNSMAEMGMAMAVMLRDSFNNADLSQTEDNLDWVAKLYYDKNENTSYYLGLARKSRAPSYQERYLWMAMEATAGLADGNTYLGNPELESEVAHEIEMGVDYLAGKVQFSPRIFYRDVTDFIQGTGDGVPTMSMMGMMMPMPVSDLMFNNVDAEFYGVDLDWRYAINEHWALNGVVNYVRGKRTDISDDLYRIAPLNATLALSYQESDWGVIAENVLYSKQDNVSETNNEKETAGYGILNISGYWQASEPMRVSLSLQNALDKAYEEHLGGYNRVADNTGVIPVSGRLPGYGRNLSLRVDYTW